jgi:hypothetical protein
MFTFELGLYEDKIDRDLKFKPEHVSNYIAETAGKAKYQFYQYLSDIYDWSFGDFLKWCYCKKVGIADISHLFGDHAMFESMKQSRGIPYAYQGMRVEVCGKPGVIVGSNSSLNLDVIFDGQWHAHNCHPHYETVYFDRESNIVGDFRAKNKQIS